MLAACADESVEALDFIAGKLIYSNSAGTGKRSPDGERKKSGTTCDPI